MKHLLLFYALSLINFLVQVLLMGWRPGPWTPEEHEGGGAPSHPGQEESKYVEDKEAEDKAKSWLQRKCETGF